MDGANCYGIPVSELSHKLDVHSNQPRFRNLFERLSASAVPLIPLSEVATEIFSGTTPLSGGEAYTERNDGVPFIRSGEINEDGTVSNETEMRITVDVHDKIMKRSQLRPGDVLIAIVGATIGKVGVYSLERPANINQAIAPSAPDTSP